MVKDVITVIHDCLKKIHVIFITNFIERDKVDNKTLGDLENQGRLAVQQVLGVTGV